MWSDDEVSLNNEQRTELAQEIPFEDILRDIEDIGSSTEESPKPTVPVAPEHPGGSIVNESK